MKESVKSFTKVIAYVAAAFVILFAILVVGVKLLTPEIEKHHANIETWASNILDSPVTIKKIRISWFQYQPVITLEGVTGLDKETRKPFVQIQKIRVFFSIIDSIRQKNIVLTQIMLSGTDVNITVNEKGEYRLQGFPSLVGAPGEQPFEHDTDFIKVIAWLSQQQTNVVLNDVDIHYLPFTATKRFITLYNLRFENSGNKHIILGKAILHQKLATEVTVAGEWEGGKDISSIKAKGYLYVAGLSLPQWLTDKMWKGWRIDEGMSNAKIWLTWENGTLQQLQTIFEAYNIKLYSDTDKKAHAVTRLSGDLGWRREGENQVLAGDDIFIDLPGHLWPSTSFYLIYTSVGKDSYRPIGLDVEYLDLADLQNFMYASPKILTDAQHKLLSEINLTGSVEKISVNFSKGLDDIKEVDLSAQFQKLSFLQHESVPGIKNLAGALTWSKNQGKLTLNTNNLIFTDDRIFANPFIPSHLKGEVSFIQQGQSKWLLESSSIRFSNKDLNLEAKGSFVINDVMAADISANFDVGSVKHITHYLPQKIFSKDLNAWLNQAFLSGKIKNGTAILRGPIKEFPFDNSNGQFQIKANPNQVTLRFAPDWPTIEKIDAAIEFSKRKIIIDVKNGETLGIPISHVRGDIPSLGDVRPSVLSIDAGWIKTDFSKALNYVTNSPLTHTIGKLFKDAEANGGVLLKLGLMVPLSHPGNTTVLGDLTLNNASLNFVPWHIEVNKLNGQVHFTENTTTATGITGELFSQPIQLNLQTIPNQSKHSVIRANVTAPLFVKDLESWLKMSFSNKLEGSTTFSANLDFSNNQPLIIQLQSNLVGIKVNMDQEYSKSAEKRSSFEATIKAEEKQPLKVLMKYQKQLSAGLLIGSANDQFKVLGINLGIGDVVPALPVGEGLYLSGIIPKLNWEMLKGYKEKVGKESFINLPLKGINVRVNSIELGGQTINGATLQLTPEDEDWLINISSAAVTGQIQLPMNVKTSSEIEAQFDQINLASPNGKKSNFSVDPKSLPTIKFSAKKVFYNDMPLGRVKFNLLPSLRGVSIESLTVNSRVFELQSKGEWLVTRKGSMTTLKGSGQSDNVSNFLERLGFDVHNFIATTGKITFDLKWDNAPYDLSLATMDGHVNIDLAKGRIAEIGKSNGAQMDLGRMLSLFSLQTIPRRLSLDFSDIFQKGYSFDYFRGNFKFEDGNAYTSDMTIDGPVANVGILGRIGLVAKDFDLTMNVNPHVTSSIPIAATLITGQPVIGLAALAVSSVIGSQVSKATSYLYKVTGPWSNPSWDTISEPGKKR